MCIILLCIGIMTTDSTVANVTVAKNLSLFLSVKRILQNYSSDSDTSSDDEWQLFKKERKKRIARPRIQNYTQSVVARYLDYEFKSHFRLDI